MIQEEFAKEIQKTIHRLEKLSLSQKLLIIGHPDAIKPIKDYFGDKYEYSTRLELDKNKIYIFDKVEWNKMLEGGAE